MAISTRIPSPQKRNTEQAQHPRPVTITKPRGIDQLFTDLHSHPSKTGRQTTISCQDVDDHGDAAASVEIKSGRLEVGTGRPLSVRAANILSHRNSIDLEEQGREHGGVDSMLEDVTATDAIHQHKNTIMTAVVMSSTDGTRNINKTGRDGEQSQPASKAQQVVVRKVERVSAGTKTMATIHRNNASQSQSSQIPSSIKGKRARNQQRQTPNSHLRTPTPSNLSQSLSRSTSTSRPMQMSPPKQTTKPPSQASHRALSQTPTLKRSATLSSSRPSRHPLSNQNNDTTTPSKPTTPRPTPRPHPPQPTGSSTPLSKTPFTTYQRSFTPSKSSSTYTFSTTTTTTTGPQDLHHLRQQTHLLHLSLLSSAAPSTLSQYISSARSHLGATHATLQSIHADLLPLVQRARQYRNLHAMDSWSGGNIVGLSRKLNAVIGVLEELLALTHRPGDQGGQEGAYEMVVKRFVTWIAWVEGVWAARDAASSSGDGMDDATTTPLVPTLTLTPIEPLGDAFISDIRSLTHLLHSLSLRLQEVRETPFPVPPRSQTPAQTATTTPQQIVQATLTLLSNMQEELQVIREVEFEVVVGEGKWREGGLRGLEREIGRGFGG